MPVVQDDYPGVAEFGAEPTKVSADTIRQIEFEATDSRPLGRKMRLHLVDHPKLGAVLIMDKDDGTGGFVYADGVIFAG